MSFIEDTVSFLRDGITLAGTVAYPRDSELKSCVVFITGSGIQDRNNTIAGFPMFRLLAAALAERGIASLRCDDRGAGGSGGIMRESTLDVFADDAVEGMNYLRRRLAATGLPAGFIGHSEGGAVALLAASRSDPDFVVMLAGPGAPVETNILAQTELIGQANGDSSVRIARETALIKRIFQVIRRDEPGNSLFPDFLEYAEAEAAGMPQAQRMAISDIQSYARVLLRQRIIDMDTRWFRSLLAFNTAGVLPGMDCPVLALYGERDLQVPAGINISSLQEIVSSGCATVETEIFPQANHLFLSALSGSPAEYSRLPHEFVPAFTERIADWIIRISSRGD